LDSNIEGLKNEYKFKLEIRSSQIQTLFTNPNTDQFADSVLLLQLLILQLQLSPCTYYCSRYACHWWVLRQANECLVFASLLVPS